MISGLQDPDNHGKKIIRLLRRSCQYIFTVPLVAKKKEVKSQRKLITACHVNAEKWEKGELPADKLGNAYRSTCGKIRLEKPLDVFAKSPLSFARTFTKEWRNGQSSEPERQKELIEIGVIESTRIIGLHAPSFLASLDPQNDIRHLDTLVQIVIEELNIK